MDAPATYCRTTSAMLRHVAGEHLLVPVRRDGVLDAEMLYVLDDVGASVWKALARTCDLDALQAAVQDEFDVPPDTDVRSDLQALLDDLLAQGLAQREDPR